MLEVTREDREAVRAFQEASIRYMHRALTDDAFGSSVGDERDYNHPIYQAFAAHAKASAIAERDRLLAQLRELPESVADKAYDLARPFVPLLEYSVLVMVSSALADALEQP